MTSSKAQRRLLALFLLPHVLGQSPIPHPTITTPPQLSRAIVAAIEPTTAGQIGINPVDIPPVSEFKAPIGIDSKYLTDLGGTSTQWIGVDSWLTPTATGESKPEPTKKAYAVTKNAAGAIEVTLSKWLHDKLVSFSANLPSCGPPAARNRMMLFRRLLDADIATCRRRNLGKSLQRAVQDPEVRAALEELGNEATTVSQGAGRAAEMAQEDLALSFGGDAAAGLVADSGIITETVAVRGALLTGAGIMALMGTVRINEVGGVTFNNPFDGMWKFVMPEPKVVPSKAFKDKPTPTATQPSSTSTSSACPTERSEMSDCDATGCKGKPEALVTGKSRCTEGPRKDCECLESETEVVEELYEDWYWFQEQINSWPDPPPRPPPRRKQPECNMDDLITGFPENLFRGGVYKKFCDEVGKRQDSSLSWVVDSSGEKKQNMIRRGRRIRRIDETSRFDGDRNPLRARTPPAKPDTYRDWKISLMWEPAAKADMKTCERSCGDAFEAMANSPCGHVGGEQNAMVSDIKYDVGCGTYRTSIRPPGVPKVPFARQCFKRDEFGPHNQVYGAEVNQAAAIFCLGIGDKNMGSGDAPLVYNCQKGTKPERPKDISWKDVALLPWSSDMRLEVRWDKERCPDNRDSFSILYPLGKTNPSYCAQNFKDVHDHCDNGDTGGARTYGCLAYEFKPYK